MTNANANTVSVVASISTLFTSLERQAPCNAGCSCCMHPALSCRASMTDARCIIVNRKDGAERTEKYASGANAYDVLCSFAVRGKRETLYW